MGQAKQRGTPLERRNMAMHRKEQERILKEQRRLKKNLKTSLLIGTIIVLSHIIYRNYL